MAEEADFTPGPAAMPEPEAAKPADPRRRAVEALMRLAAIRPWDEIELPAIAEEAGLSLKELRGLFPSKLSMLGGVTRIVDDEVMGEAGSELAGEPYRERVFDIVMRRLDALAPFKPGLRRIAPAIRRDPATLAALNRGAVNSWRYMLASAGIPTEDALGPVRIQGAVVLMARVSEVWLDDDEPELSRTMARLDRELDTATRMMKRFEDLHRLSAPFRGIARAICGGGQRMRRRERAGGDMKPGETEDFAPAI